MLPCFYFLNFYMFVVLCKTIINNGLSPCILLCVTKHAKRTIMQFAQAHLGLYCPSTESKYTMVYVDE